MATFSMLESHSLKISDPLIFMVFPWGKAKSSDNGQDIEYIFAEKSSDSEQIQCLAHALCHALHKLNMFL